MTNPMQAKIEQAAQARETAKTSLYRSDGEPKYGETEMTERDRTIEREHRERFDAIEADIAGRIERAEEDLAKHEHSDPAAALNTEELERANAKSAFVSDECRSLSLDALTKRMGAVLALGDRPTMFLYAHHAAPRVGEPRAYDPHNPSARDEEGAGKVRKAAAGLMAALDPDRERETGRARESLKDWRKLKDQAYLRRRGARSVGELYSRQAYGDIARRLGQRTGCP